MNAVPTLNIQFSFRFLCNLDKMKVGGPMMKINVLLDDVVYARSRSGNSPPPPPP